MQYYILKRLHKWSCISILNNLPTWMKNLWMLNWALNAWYMCSRSALSRAHSSFLLCFRASSLWKSMAYSTLPVSQMRCQISMAAGWPWLESGQVSKSLNILFRLGLFSWKTKTAFLYISFQMHLIKNNKKILVDLYTLLKSRVAFMTLIRTSIDRLIFWALTTSLMFWGFPKMVPIRIAPIKDNHM